MIWPSILKVKMESRICSIQLKFVSIRSMTLKEKVKVMIVAFKSSVHQHRTHDLASNSKSEDGVEDLKHTNLKFGSIGPM